MDESVVRRLEKVFFTGPERALSDAAKSFPGAALGVPASKGSEMSRKCKASAEIDSGDNDCINLDQTGINSFVANQSTGKRPLDSIAESSLYWKETWPVYSSNFQSIASGRLAVSYTLFGGGIWVEDNRVERS